MAMNASAARTITTTDRLKKRAPEAIEKMRYVLDGECVPEKVIITAWLTPAGAIRDLSVAPDYKPA